MGINKVYGIVLPLSLSSKTLFMESGVVFFGRILKGYTSVTVSTPSGFDEVCELTETSWGLFDETLEEVFETLEEVFEL